MAIFGALSQVDGTANTVFPDLPSASSVAVGDWVRLDGTNTIVRALADNTANSLILGVVENKPTATTADVRYAGVTETIFTGLDTSKDYFLSEATPGAMTTTPPTGSGEVVLRLGRPQSATEFVIYNTTRMVRQ